MRLKKCVRIHNRIHSEYVAEPHEINVAGCTVWDQLV